MRVHPSNTRAYAARGVAVSTSTLLVGACAYRGSQAIAHGSLSPANSVDTSLCYARDRPMSCDRRISPRPRPHPAGQSSFDPVWSRSLVSATACAPRAHLPFHSWSAHPAGEGSYLCCVTARGVSDSTQLASRPRFPPGVRTGLLLQFAPPSRGGVTGAHGWPRSRTQSRVVEKAPGGGRGGESSGGRRRAFGPPER